MAAPPDDREALDDPLQRHLRGAAPPRGQRSPQRPEPDAQPDRARQRGVAQARGLAASRAARRACTSSASPRAPCARCWSRPRAGGTRDKRGGGRGRSSRFDEALERRRRRAPTSCSRSTPRSTTSRGSNPRQALMVESRFFGGLDVAETAQLLEVSEATVLRDWRAAQGLARARAAPRTDLDRARTTRGPMDAAPLGARSQALFHAAVELPDARARRAFLERGRARRRGARRATCSRCSRRTRAADSLLDRGVARRRRSRVLGAMPTATAAARRVRAVPRSPACSAKAAWASCTSPSATTSAARRRSRCCATRGSRPRGASASPASSARSRSSTIRPSRGCYDADTLAGRHAVVRDGVRRGRAAHRALPRRAARRSPSGCACSARCARRCSTRTGTCHPSRPQAVEHPRAPSDGAVKLLDFGIAKQLERSSGRRPTQTRTGLRLMTPAYAAPEQMRGERGRRAHRRLRARRGALRAARRTAAVRPRGAHAGRGGDDRPRARRPSGRRWPPRAAPRGWRRAARAWADLDVLCLTAMHKEPRAALPHRRRADPRRRPLPARRAARGAAGLARATGWASSCGGTGAPLSAAGAVLALRRRAQSRSTPCALPRRATRRWPRRRARSASSASCSSLFEGGDEAAGPADTLRVVTLSTAACRRRAASTPSRRCRRSCFRRSAASTRSSGSFDRADTLLRARARRRRAARAAATSPSTWRSALVALGLLRVDQAQFDDAERWCATALATVTARAAAGPSGDRAGDGRARPGARGARRTTTRRSPCSRRRSRAARGRRRSTPELAAACTELANAHFYAGHYDVCRLAQPPRAWRSTGSSTASAIRTSRTT